MTSSIYSTGNERILLRFVTIIDTLICIESRDTFPFLGFSALAGINYFDGIDVLEKKE